MKYKENYTSPRSDDEGAGETRRSRAVLLSDVGAPRVSRRHSESIVSSPCKPKGESVSDEAEYCKKKKILPSKQSGGHAYPPFDASPEGEGYAVLDVHPNGEGEMVAVVMTRPLDGDPSGGVERATVRLLVEQYAELSPKRGVMTPEQADELFRAGRLAEAVRRALIMLQYGDLSERRLTYKLTAKGIERAVAEEAALYLVDKGLIAEDCGAVRRAEQGVRKLWGPRRIREDLRAQGYEREAIDAAMLSLEDGDVNFAENCAAVIRRKWGGIPTDRAARAKYRAALLRLGYESETVREAEYLIQNEEA